MAKQLNVNLAFTADTGQARAQIQDLQNQLSHLSTSVGAGQTLGLTKELNQAAVKVTELKGLLASSTTPMGTLDLGKFNEGLKKSGTTIKDYARSLNALGPEGQKAFAQLAQSITTAEMPMRRANGLLNEMWTTMKNTARWQLTSSMIHGFMGGLQKAVGYAKDLNKTLTDIRIVAPEKSMEDMYQFAALANKQAKELSSTTLDYAKGALIYYQQGLDDVATKERTDVTTKMANVTGDSVDEVSSYMTSIWNNFNKAGDESEEHFADILTKLGAETAASTTEITAALEKYTGVANTIGLSYESATAAATTLIDRLREQPEVAGTALKTIFARLEGLKLEGETSEGGTTTSLNKYSEALHKIGVEIKDASGEMREADDILMDIGEKWNSGDLSKDVKIATAETVAGIRQWQQFSALMDNFDYFKQYKDLAATGSEGALQEQQEIYAESWEAASNRVKSSIQTIYMQLLDDKFFIKLTNKMADLIDGLSKFIDGVGGLKTILPALGTLMFAAFGDKMAKGISNMAYNMKLFGKAGKEAMQQTRQQANEALINQQFGNSISGKAAKQTYQEQFNLQNKVLEKQEQLNEFERKQVQFILDQNAALGEQIRLKAQTVEEAQKDLEREIGRSGSKYLGYSANKTDKENFKNEYRQMAQHGYASGFANNIAKNLSASVNQVSQLEKEYNQLNQLQRELTPEEKERIELYKIQKQELEEQIQEYQRIISEDEMLSKNAKKKIEKAVTNRNVDELDDIAVRQEEAFQQSFNKLVNTKGSALDPKEMNVLRERFQQMGGDVEAFKRSLTDAQKAAFNFDETIENMGRGLKNGSQVLMEFSSVLMSSLMAFEAIKNVVEVFKNPDATFGEQMIATLTAMTMVIPAVVSGLQLFNIENVKAVASSLATSAALKTEAAAATTTSAAFKALGKSMLAFLANPYVLAFLAIAGAVAAVAIALKKNYDSTHQARQEYQELQASVAESNKSFDELSSKVDSLNNSLESLESQKKSISELTSGTSEWTEAVGKLNEETQNAVDEFNALNESLPTDDQFGELRYKKDYWYDDQGVLQLSDEAQENIAQIKISVQEIAKTSKARNEKILAESKQAAGIEALSKGNLGNGQKLTHSDEYVKEQEDIIKELYKEGNILAIQEDKRRMSSEQQDKNLEKLNNTLENINNNSLMMPWMNAYSSELQKNFELNKKAETKQFDTSETGTLADSTLEIIQQAVMRGELDSGKLGNQEYLEKLLTTYGESTEKAAQQADLIANNAKELRESLIDNTLATKAATEKYLDILQQRILNDTENPFNDYIKDNVEEKYQGGAAGYIAENWLLAQKSVKDATGEDYKNARIEYAKSQGYTTKDDGKTFQNEAGEEKTFDDEASEKEIQGYYKESQALKELNGNKKQYTDFLEKEIKDSKRDNKAIDSLTAAYKRNSKLFKDYKKNAGEIADLLQGELKDNLIEVLDISDPKNYDSIFNDEFIKKNGATIQEALNGDKQALDDLYDAYQAEDFILNISSNTDFQFNEDDLKDKFNDFQAWVDENAQIGVPIDVSTDEALQKVNGFLGQMVSNVADKASIVKELNSQGFSVDEGDIEFVKVTIPADSTIDMASITNLVTTTEPGPDLQAYNIDANEDGLEWNISTKPTTRPVNSPGSPKQYVEATHNPQTRTLYIPRIKGGSGATFTKSNYTLPQSSGGGQRSSRQPSSGSGNGGGGRGRRATRARERTAERARRQNEKSKVLERYKEITDKLERNSRASERLSKVQDKLYGKARLDQMDKVNKKHLEEIKLLEKKQKEARQYYLNDRRDAEKALKQAMKVSKQVQKQEHERLTVAQKNALNDIKGLKFNSSGEITNYTDILKALQDQLNAYERVYNSAKEFGNAESQSQYKEKYIDPLKEQIDSLKEAMDQYDETRELAEEVRDQIEEAYTAWQQSNYEKLQYALELKVTINDNDLKRIDYYLSKTSGNVYKAAEALGQYFGTSSKGIANFQKSSNKLQERLKELEKSREEVQKKINERTAKEKENRKDYNELKKKKKVENKKYGKKRTYTINGEKVTLNKKEGAKYWSKSIERNLKKKRDAAKKAYEKKKNDKNVSEKEKERLKNKYLKAEAKLREVQQIRRKYQAKLDELIEEGAKGLKGIKQKRNSYKRDTVTYKTKSGKKRTVSIEKLTKEYNEAYKKQKEKVEELKKKRDKYKKGSKKYEKYNKQYDKAKDKLENITKKYENRLFKNNKYNQKKYDYAKKKYNNYANKAEEWKKKRDKYKKGSKEWNDANDQYKKYLDLRKKWKKLFKKQQTNKAQYEKWQIAYENYKKLNDELKKRNQIIKNQEKAIAEANKNLAQFTMLTASGGKIGAVTKAIYNQVQAFEDLSTSYKLAQITQADYIDSMQQIHDEIYSLLSELQDLKNELKGYYGETLTNALDELNKYNDKLTHNESLISHFQNIANLSRWDDSNNQWTDKFLLAQQESIGTKLENDRKLLKNLQDERDEALLKRNKFILNEVAGKNLSDQKLLNASLADINGVLDSDALSDERRKWIDKKIKEAKAERDQAKKELDNLLKNENASQKKINEAKEKYLKANATVEQYSNVSEEEFKDLINTTYEYYDEIYQSLSANFDQIQEEFYSTAEEALENANNLLEEFCDRAASNMERLLTGIAGGFEELSKRISLTSQLQEDYLTKTNQDYELNKMQRTLQKDIDKANSKTAKNKLSNFAKELKSLQESNKLSNLELEIAQKRYEILKAQIELEESRGAKQTIRLSRDNEGNYGYVYVANEEETEDAEQNVKNLENDLYNLLRENINNREQSYIQLAQDRENALTEIWGRFYNQEITASERDELLANANKQYSQLMESQSHLINIASTSVEGISDLAKQDSWVDSEYSGFVTRIQNNLAAYDAYSENMRNAYKQFEATVSQLHITGDTVNEELTKISETNADVLNDFNTSLNKIDKVLDEVQDKILKFTQNTLPIIESQISVVEDKLQSFADTIERFVTGKLNTNDVAYTNFSTLITRLADNAGVATEDTMLWNNGVAFNAEVGGKAFYNSNKWGSDVAKANDKTAGKMLDIINSGEGAVGTRVFGVSEEGYLFYLLTNKTMQDSDNGAALKKKIEEWKDKHNIKQKVDDILTYQQFASGGYTGDWNTGGQEGKIGILHEKELVLNQTDTSNILAAVEGMRELASSGFLNSLSALSLPDKLLANSAQQLDQNVSIEASFPNVTDRNEIEQAFNNLVNRASQYAYTNRK